MGLVWFGFVHRAGIYKSSNRDTKTTFTQTGLKQCLQSPGANFRAVCHFKIIKVHIPSFHTFKKKLRYRKEHRYIFLFDFAVK